MNSEYADYVEHPRYGRGPNRTGLNPSPHDPGVRLHWNAVSHAEIVQQYESALGEKYPYAELIWSDDRPRRIPHTAIVADLDRQTPATVPATHYYDVERRCRDCGRPFIFFAREQKHWYEELGFGLDSDCVRCVDCRRRQQGIAHEREQYESLFHVADKTPEQCLRMAEACLTLVEAGQFTAKKTQRVRMLLNQLPADDALCNSSRFADVTRRLQAIERQGG